MEKIECPAPSLGDIFTFGECRENEGQSIGRLKLIVPIVNQHPLSVRGVRMPRLFNLLPDIGDMRYLFDVVS